MRRPSGDSETVNSHSELTRCQAVCPSTMANPATMALLPNVTMGHRCRRDELTCQLTLRSYPSQYGARSRNFWSFPVAVRGSSSRNSTCFGHL